MIKEQVLVRMPLGIQDNIPLNVLGHYQIIIIMMRSTIESPMCAYILALNKLSTQITCPCILCYRASDSSIGSLLIISQYKVSSMVFSPKGERGN